jgi:glutaredoxin-related protein
VNGELVGGCDIVLDLHRSGELKKMLTEAGVVQG